MQSPTVQQAFDPRKNGRYKAQLGPELQTSDIPADFRYSSVKLNHRPNLKNCKRTTLLKENGDNPDKCTLTINDHDEQNNSQSKYIYKGSHSNDRQSYLLVLDTSTQNCTLHPIIDEYKLNLESAPAGSTEEGHLHEYTKISSKTIEDESVNLVSLQDTGAISPAGNISNASSDSGDISNIDENNPYDFRQYLDGSPFGSQASSPGLPATSYSIESTQRSKENNVEKSLKPLPGQRAKSSPERKSSQIRLQSARSSVPEVRLDRRASTLGSIGSSMPQGKAKPRKKGIPLSKSRVSTDDSCSDGDNEDSEHDKRKDDEEEMNRSSNALEIDYGDSPPPQSRRRDIQLALARERSGPISFKSAASSASPASRLHTPNNRLSSQSPLSRNAASGQDVIDFPNANGSSEDDNGPKHEKQGDDRVDVSSDEDDVEDISLPAAAHGTSSVKAQRGANDDDAHDGDEDDGDADLEAEMMQGLIETEETQTAPPPESESESEAE